ncbi:Predicted NTP pyrophosphohydrolase, NUDIX family [Tistlia consotensis]|uniref:Predicted NTP pyrophosphohydrolase, NUDIX family n=1 Tax=Tistlia consotensis USBA 355 TaxID=560819 RepID=A0A1Y6BVB4_9PROT|nr:NUDIX domain-containing protein [Tistlia consotensis]SMF29128.1 Predicted NTP pyrophosphohydrolase, NUDIX family [Tistlia consotensis USBA 355]SNR91589.1 Predicted NTP pyrophosphohydrolase, NUDIX family [Tistlia consotensis]
MAKESAGLLLYRRRGAATEVFLVHPGGPFWAKRDAGAWSIPKGEPAPGEEPLAAARREVAEETGLAVEGPFRPLEPCRQKGGKLVQAWAVEAGGLEWDPAASRANTVEIEWPPRSGRTLAVPEVDRAEWLGLAVARTKINPAQAVFLDQLERLLDPSRDA